MSGVIQITPDAFQTKFLMTISRLVCLSVPFIISEPAHLDAIALRLQHGQPPDNKLLVLIVPDFDVKASLSNKSEQNQKLASYTRPLFEALYYSHMESWEETLGFSAGSTVRLLQSHAAC